MSDKFVRRATIVIVLTLCAAALLIWLAQDYANFQNAVIAIGTFFLTWRVTKEANSDED